MGWGLSHIRQGPRICGLGLEGAVPFLNLLGHVPSCFLSCLEVGWGCRPGVLGSLTCLETGWTPLQEGLPSEEKSEEEKVKEEDSSFKLCVPGIVAFQSPLYKTFRSTDTVRKGFRPSPPTWPQAQEASLWPVAQGCNTSRYHQMVPEDLR